MTLITDLNLGDIIEVSYLNGQDTNFRGEVTELHFEVLGATVYDGTQTQHINDKDEFEIIKPVEEIRTAHYQSNTDDGIDLIDFWHMQMSKEEFRGAMKSQISKYAIRLGRKDEEIAELKKIEDYARRYRQKLEQAQ